MRRLLSFFRPKRSSTQDRRTLAYALKKKYNYFKDLIDSNSELLKIIAEIQEKLQGDQVFGSPFVASRATRAVFHAMRMADCLNALSGGKHQALYAAAQKITGRIQELQGSHTTPETSHGKAYVLNYDEIGRDMAPLVGGKSANLGEILRAGLNIPDGFAITTAAYDALARENDLLAGIAKLRMEFESEDPAALTELSESIQRLFIQATIPDDLERAILDAYDSLSARSRVNQPLVALRSSAIGEDSEVSFAGQYLSILAVPRDQILQSYLMILASLFTPRAIAYRLHQGIADSDIAMSVACLEMIEARSSGVAYSRDPVSTAEERVLVNAVWGLGPYAVDGVVPPDSYRLTREQRPRLIQQHIAKQPFRLVAGSDGLVEQEIVEEELQAAPCLSQEQVELLASGVMALENHFAVPQDVEWALDFNDRLIFLQSRPLALSVEPDTLSEREPPEAEAEVLIDDGDTACPGVGAGPAFHLDPDGDMDGFPQGGVVLAQHSSPKLMLVLPRAAAVVTEVGSVTGHMASLTREFNVPALMNCSDALTAIPSGAMITVDASNRRIYRGRVDHLLIRQKERRSAMKGTSVYKELQDLAELVVPLNLLDPKSPSFAPQNCKTLHDVMRMAHELSYKEMFLISDLTSGVGKFSLALDAPIPLDLHIIDLGEGLAELPPGAKRVRLEQIASRPFRALLHGLLHDDLAQRGPRPVNLGGFFSVLSQQMLSPPGQGMERFGDRSYALVSDKYLNFSSRVGYHYSIVDAFCGGKLNENYVNFEFKGGAADDARRNRRARAIADILREMDFKVEVVADRVVGRYQKYEAELIEERLDMLGRLLQFTRQMDMLMTDEASVQAMKESFLGGRYDYNTPVRK